MMTPEKFKLSIRDIAYITTLCVSVALAWSSVAHQSALAIEELRANMVPRTEYHTLLNILSDIQQRVSRIEGQLTR